MDSGCGHRVVDSARTPPASPQDCSEYEYAVAAWHEYEANKSAPVHSNTTLQVLKVPVPMAYSNSVLSDQQGWQNVAILQPPASFARFEIFKQRCATARDALDNALNAHEIATYMVLGKSTPTFTAEVAEYLAAFKKAQIAGHAIFAPQNAYRSAIRDLGTFINHLANILPGKNAIKENAMAQMKKGMDKANQKEEGAREVLRGLAEYTSHGKMREALMTYMEILQLRVKSWGVLEADLMMWAEKCLGELDWQ